MLYTFKVLFIRVMESDDVAIYYEENEKTCNDWIDGKIGRFMVDKGPYVFTSWKALNDCEIGDLLIIRDRKWQKL